LTKLNPTAANYRHRKVTTPIKPEVAKRGGGTRSSGQVSGNLWGLGVSVGKNSTKSMTISPALARQGCGGQAGLGTAPPARKIRGESCPVELEATKATTNGLKAGDSGGLSHSPGHTPGRRAPWSKKKAAEVMFSGLPSKMFSEMKAPPPHPLADRRLKLRHAGSIVDSGRIRRPAQLERSASEDRRVKAGSLEFCSLASHSVISRCDKARLKAR
jgi:hypothetical protein